MKGRLIHRDDICRLVDLLRQDWRVVAPFEGKGRDSYFDEVTDSNKEAITLHLPNPYYPPKRYVLPHIQKLFKMGNGSRPFVEEIREGSRVAVFSIRSCDIEGIFHLDRFYLGNPFIDDYYEALRSRLFLVNMVCTDKEKDIDEDCFCVCADAGPAARDHFDLQLMDLHGNKGEFLAVARTPAAEALFSQPFFRKMSPEHVNQRRSILEDVRKSFKNSTSWYSAATKFITQAAVNDATWKHVGDRCLECGGCSYVCPTCSCFTVTDRETGPGTWERVRMWDSCALSGFTRMAGGHNPRKAVHDRRNRRFFHKLEQMFIQRQFSVGCVGCGRCARVCHGDVGMPKVVEILRRETAGSERTNQA
jgi:ferredoxin